MDRGPFRLSPRAFLRHQRRKVGARAVAPREAAAREIERVGEQRLHLLEVALGAGRLRTLRQERDAQAQPRDIGGEVMAHGPEHEAAVAHQFDDAPLHGVEGLRQPPHVRRAAGLHTLGLKAGAEAVQRGRKLGNRPGLPPHREDCGERHRDAQQPGHEADGNAEKPRGQFPPGAHQQEAAIGQPDGHAQFPCGPGQHHRNPAPAEGRVEDDGHLARIVLPQLRPDEALEQGHTLQQRRALRLSRLGLRRDAGAKAGAADGIERKLAVPLRQPVQQLREGSHLRRHGAGDTFTVQPPIREIGRRHEHLGDDEAARDDEREPQRQLEARQLPLPPGGRAKI